VAESNEFLNLSTDLIEYDVTPLQADAAPGVEFEHNATPYRFIRPKGAALHPERYDLIKLNRIKKTIPNRFWSALYQQNPVPDEGLYFPKENFRYVPLLPVLENCRIVTAWDFAIGVKQQNDWTVGATIAQFPGDKCFVLGVTRFKGDTYEIIEAILSEALRFSIEGADYTLGVEDGQIWRSIKPVLQKAMSERRAFIPIEECKPFTDKLVRARPLQAMMQQGLLYWPEKEPWATQAIGEMLRFPGGAHDDVVDAMAWAARIISSRSPPREVEPKKPPSWRDKLAHTGGRTYMSA
jgi:predicted phage terminase large subunit-like protein